MIEKNSKFLIIGLGLIGGSYALNLKEKGHTVYAIDISKKTLAYALNNKIIDQGSSNLTDFINKVDYIILAVYPHLVLDYLSKIATKAKNNLIITDVTGIKEAIVDKAEKILPDNTEFIASHPMAGKAVGSIFNASLNLFKDANFIITPTTNSSPEAITFLKDLATTLGFAKTTQLMPKMHDRMIAYTSQLTHAIAVSLINVTPSEEIFKYSGDSFKDLTRIAEINEVLWSELFLNNKNNLVEQIDTFIDELTDLRNIINDCQKDKLSQKLINSTILKRKFNDLKKKD